MNNDLTSTRSKIEINKYETDVRKIRKADMYDATIIEEGNNETKENNQSAELYIKNGLRLNSRPKYN